jgi:hypothetical protein
VVIESPYRETVRPVQLYVRQLRRDYPGDVISIIIPEYVVRTLVAEPASQPDRTATQGEAALRAVDHGHERAVGERRSGAMTASTEKVSYVRADDLLADPVTPPPLGDGGPRSPAAGHRRGPSRCSAYRS